MKGLVLLPLLLSARPVTYRDVAPIVAARCQPCHAEDSIAPFTFDSYADLREHSRPLLVTLQSRLMPPWPPAEGCQPLAESRRLPDAEQNLLVQWVEAGMPEGPPLQTAPKRAKPLGLPWVDAALSADPYLPAFADGASDEYRCFVIDPKLKADRDLIGVEIVPGAPKSVHHAMLYLAAPEDARAMDAADPKPGWSCFGGPGTRMPQLAGGWAPGSGSARYPAGTGVRMAAGKVLVLQVHYTKGRKAADEDRTLVRLQLAKGAVAKPATILPLSKHAFEIPAHAKGHRETRTYKMPTAATLWGLMPHMHALGKQLKAAKKSDCLIDIPSWDFDWHQFYFYENPAGVALQEGDELQLTCEWDNPGEAPVQGGETATHETCLAFLYLTY